MTFLIAAAGTGGHVFPGLAVGEALIDFGVKRRDVLFVGGGRLESSVYPAAGFPFLQVELRGLRRSLSTQNLALPRIVLKARNLIAKAIADRGVGVALGMGGYVTVPAALAAKRSEVPLMISEQNAGAGLANRIVQRWAIRRFAAFPDTHGLPGAEWVGNPVRSAIRDFDRGVLRSLALDRYTLSGSSPVVGVFGGSLGAGAINTGVAELAATWGGPLLQILHLTGERDYGGLADLAGSNNVVWKRVAFESEMEFFYAASDVVVARAGGAVAELTATATPSILIPGGFGSSGHQLANASFLERSGAAIVLEEGSMTRLSHVVSDLLLDTERLSSMKEAAGVIARPKASEVIAKAMLGVVS